MRKPIKWTLIGLGIFLAISIVIVIIFLVFLFISTGITTFAKEFRPETKEPTKLEEKVIPSKDEKDSNLIIRDLAYIKILCGTYTDDADPEDDCISIDISFYDSKSEHISFEDIPIVVNIKLYATKINWDTGEEEIIEPPVYEGSIQIDHSMRISEMFGKYIRIPYKDIGPLPDKEYPWGKAIVTVNTKKQGEFKAEEIGIPLSPY
ncbi:MAG: hypothetical protein Q8N27_04790 [Candidatus Hydromicrobium sp.]|nr:hypothetical protein [Candidatus Hydromicrobium sp.]